jgi:hypothetical protein
MNQQINKAFKDFQNSRCMDTVLSITNDPRIDGTTCSLYFDLLKRIDRFGHCQIQPEVNLKYLKILKDAGYLDLYVLRGVFNIQFKFI